MYKLALGQGKFLHLWGRFKKRYPFSLINRAKEKKSEKYVLIKPLLRSKKERSKMENLSNT
jgi:hypothetical protein